MTVPGASWADSLGRVLGHRQCAVKNFDVLGLTTWRPSRTWACGLSSTNNKQHRGDKMETKMPLGQRIARFIETRYVHRSHPHYLPELASFGIILILAVWPMLSLVATALERMR